MSKTEDKKHLIIKLKEILNDLELDEYRLSDGYLLRWLQYANYDLKKASQFLRKSLKWRQENGIDSILAEDFSDLEAAFPFDITGVDKHGRLIIRVSVNTFNSSILKLDCRESRERYSRYVFWFHERVEKSLRQRFYETNGRVNQGVAIINCENLSEHAKIIGMKRVYTMMLLLKDVVSKIATNFPRTTEITYVFNASKLFTFFLSAVKPFTCKETLANLHVFDSDSTFNWEEHLL